VSLTRQALAHLNDRGSITLTSGKIPALSGGTAGALANRGLQAFVRAAALEMPRSIRINVVCPGERNVDPNGERRRGRNRGDRGDADVRERGDGGDQQGQILVPG
jgi:NAD(P)-dependent dehydrogenase (short-subunit alcohol dehydrogenase family)